MEKCDALLFLTLSTPLCCLQDGYSTFRAKHMRLFSFLQEREEGKRKRSWESLPRAWPLEANQALPAGFLSVRGFCLDGTTRQRLVWT